MTAILRASRFFARLLRVLSGSAVFLAILAMLALNVATLVLAPLNAAAGAILGRAGLTTVSETVAMRASGAERRLARQADELDALRHVRYRGARKTVTEAVSDTASRVSTRVARATARNLAAIPAEALPVIGIGVILGATAWELADACELMKEIHQLDMAFNPDLANDPAKLEACGMEVPTAHEVWTRIFTDPEAVYESQPEDYDLQADFEKPGWWNWLRRWYGDDPPAVVKPDE